MNTTTMQLIITAKQGVTLLPRCLQVLSRRGCIITKLETESATNGAVMLRADVQAPAKWQSVLPGLLERLHDVESVHAGGDV